MPHFLDDVYVKYSPPLSTTVYNRKALLPPLGALGNYVLPIMQNMAAASESEPIWSQVPDFGIASLKISTATIFTFVGSGGNEGQGIVLASVNGFVQMLIKGGFTATNTGGTNPSKTYPCTGYYQDGSNNLFPVLDCWVKLNSNGATAEAIYCRAWLGSSWIRPSTLPTSANYSYVPLIHYGA